MGSQPDVKMSRLSSTEPEEDFIPAAEWVVAGVGLILVCVSLGFLVYKAFLVEDGPPEIAFKVEQIVPQDGGALVLATVFNKGGKTVTRLQILGRAGQEEHEVEIDFLPARSSRGFGIFFTEPPEPERVRFEPGGYQKP